MTALEAGSGLSVDQRAEQLAQSALTVGRLSDTEKNFVELVQQSPHSSVAQFWLGKILLQKKKLTEAVEHLHLSVLNNPANLTARLVYAQALSKAGNHQQAIAQLRFLLRLNANHIEAHANLADIYLAQNRTDMAVKEYTLVQQIAPRGHPKRSEARSRLNVLATREAERLAGKLTTTAERKKALTAATQWVNQNRLDPAQWLLSRLIEKQPRHAQANYLLGVIQMRYSRWQTALAYLDNATHSQPHNPAYLEAYAQVLTRVGKLQEAEQVLRAILRETENRDIRARTQQRLRMIVGEKMVRAGKLQQALQYYSKLATADANNIDLLIRISDVYISLGKAREAERVAQQIILIQRVASRKQQILNESRTLIAKGQLQAAEQKLKLLLQVEPSHSQAYYWLATVYAQQKRFAPAIQHMQNSVAYAPENMALRKEYARLLVRGGRLAEAESTYLELANIQPNEVKRKELIRLAQYVKGQQLLEEQRYEEALSHYQTMALQFPDDLSILEALASLYIKLELFDEAEETYLTALRQDETRALTHLRLAGLYTQIDSHSKRRQYYSEALRLDPVGQVGKTALDNMLAVAQQTQRDGRYGFALEEYENILSVFPNHNTALAGAAFCARQIKDYDKSKALYQRAIQNAPSNVKIRVEYARMLARAEDFETAIKQFEAIMSIAPTSVAGREANANLAILYSSRADKMIAALESGAGIDESVESARIWIQEKNRLNAAQRVLAAVLKIDQSNEKAHYWLGAIYDRQRRFDLAIQHTATSVSLAPHNLQLRAAFGRVLARAGILDAAEAVYTGIINETPSSKLGQNTKMLLGWVVGQRLVQQGKLTEALAHYQSLQASSPNDPALTARIANVYLNMQDYERAEQKFKEVLLDEPNSPSVHMQLAQLYKRKGDNEKYVREMKRVISLDPNGALGQQALNALGLAAGNAKLAAQQWDEAIAAFESILDLDADNVAANLGIATAYLESGAYNKARPVFARVLQLDPGNLQARLKLARLLVATRRTGEAALELERIVAASKYSREGREALINLTNIYRQRGAALLSQGQGDAAVREYRRAINKDPEDWRAHYELGRIFQSASQNAGPGNRSDFLDFSLVHYEKVVRLKPSHYNAHLNSASIYEARGQYEKAQKAYTYALANVANGNDALYNRLGNAIRIQGVRKAFFNKHYTWVISELQDMLRLEPNNIRLHLFLATVYIRLEELDSAIASLKQAVQLDPMNVSARYRLGQLYEQTNDLELAADQYRGILFTPHKGTIVEAARERLTNIEERLRFLTFRMQYNTGISKTRSEGVQYTPLAGETDTQSYSSTLSLDMVANLRLRKNVELSFNYSPNYSTFHDTENDSFAPTIGLTANVNFRKGFVNAHVNQRETKGLLLDDLRGRESNASFTAARRLRIPLLLAEEGAVSPSTVQWVLSGRKFKASDTTLFEIRALSSNLSLTYPFRSGGSLRLGYRYTDTSNLQPLATDYANYANNLSLSISRPLATRLFGIFSAGGTYEVYTHTDSARYRPGASTNKRRHTGQINLGFGLNYLMHRKLNVLLDVTLVEHRTSLPRGAIYDTNGNIAGIQGSLLGDYRSLNINTGIQFRF